MNVGTSRKNAKQTKFTRPSADNLRSGLAWVLCAGLIVGLGWTGASCLPERDDEPRQLTTDEAERLSDVRVRAASAPPVAVSLELPAEAGGGGFAGHLDWSRPMVHAGVVAAGDSQPDQLVQAVPGLIATREGEADADPDDVPEDDWTVRRMQPEVSGEADPRQQAVDIVLSALLSLPSQTAADVTGLREHGSWTKEAAVDGVTVDVMRAPLLLDATSPSGDAAEAETAEEQPEAVFWVDRDGQLRRIQFDPAGVGMATVDFLWERDDAVHPLPVDVLGGADNDPREVDEAEVQMLAELRQRNSHTGAEVDLAVPVADDEVIRARGYVDWRIPLAYLSVDAPGEDNDGLLLALPGGAATYTDAVDGMPDQQLPQEGWETQPWDDRVDEDDGGASHFDLLLFKLLTMSATAPDDHDEVSETSAWLREDAVGDAETAVFEFPSADDPDTDEPGQQPFRFWVGVEDDALHRVELNTDSLGMAHADLEPQEPPQLQLPPGVLEALAG